MIGSYRRIINDMDFFSMEDYAEKVKGGKKIMDAITTGGFVMNLLEDI